MRILRNFFFLANLALLQVAYAQSTLSATPPMGWNSWNHFDANVTEADVRAAADAMVANGMRDAGYIYVNIDDGWQGTRDANGNIRPNSKFSDMKALADYVHARGMKLGIYSSPGAKTCARFEGSLGHEEQDARTYASWGVDYLKYDLCSFGDVLTREGHGDQSAAFPLQKAAYVKMHDALVATGRPIVFSLCQYGLDSVWTWGAEVGGNLWRTTGDIKGNYDRMSVIGFEQAGLAKYASPGHWNDPDMLEIGNGKMTHDESITHMSLWVLLAAPLLAGNDLSHMSAETLAILENREVIAIDQDALGRQGDRFSAEGPMEIWTRPLANGDVAVGLFNRSELIAPMSIDLSKLSLGENLTLRDIWASKTITRQTGIYTTNVPKHGAVLLRVSRSKI